MLLSEWEWRLNLFAFQMIFDELRFFSSEALAYNLIACLAFMCCRFFLHFNFQVCHTRLSCFIIYTYLVLFVYIWMCKQIWEKFPFIEIDLEVEAIKIFLLALKLCNKYCCRYLFTNATISSLSSTKNFFYFFIF